MIVLDTNVVSEILKPKPSETVTRWLAAQNASEVFTTTITQAELLYGVESLAPGKRRTQLLAAIEEILATSFEGRILPFDENAAREFARIVAARDARGRPISNSDAMIAAIARTCRASVATRNATDFAGCGIAIINPWNE